MTALSVRPAWPVVAAEAADRRLLRGALLAAAMLHGIVLLVPWRHAAPPPPPTRIEPQPPNIVTTPLPPPPIVEVAPVRPVQRVPLPLVETTERPPVEPIFEPAPPIAPDDSFSEAQPFLPDPQGPPASEPLVYDETRAGLVLPRPLEGRAKPAYPQIAVVTRQQGRVVLRAVISADGRVESVEVLSAPRPDYGFATAAVEAVSSWRYTPGTVQGRPVAVSMTVIVEFTMN